MRTDRRLSHPAGNGFYTMRVNDAVFGCCDDLPVGLRLAFIVPA
jgi:hypothetical protein